MEAVAGLTAASSGDKSKSISTRKTASSFKRCSSSSPQTGQSCTEVPQRRNGFSSSGTESESRPLVCQRCDLTLLVAVMAMFFTPEKIQQQDLEASLEPDQVKPWLVRLALHRC